MVAHRPAHRSRGFESRWDAKSRDGVHFVNEARAEGRVTSRFCGELLYYDLLMRMSVFGKIHERRHSGARALQDSIAPADDASR